MNVKIKNEGRKDVMTKTEKNKLQKLTKEQLIYMIDNYKINQDSLIQRILNIENALKNSRIEIEGALEDIDALNIKN